MLNNVTVVKCERVLVAAALAAVFACSPSSTLAVQVAAATVPDAITPDGGRYFGQLVDGKLQAQGRIEWANGAWYEGEFDKGLLSGKGKYRWTNGTYYEGTLKDGMLTGQGRMVEPEGAVYVGQFANDQFNGQGRYQLADGSVYEGGFVDGLYDGNGKWRGHGEEYVGAFHKGKYNGHGELTYENGRKFTGEFVDGMYQGRGRYELPDGQFYEGDFDKDKFTGNGVHGYKSGVLHTGDFVNWLAEGAGTLSSPQGDMYQGTFVKGELVGKGTFIGKDGSRYEGEFKGSKFHGQGTYRDVGGNEYVGSFKYGVYDGEGVFTYAEAQEDGRTKDSGTWRYGQFEDKAALRNIQENVETAIYRQRALLDKTLAGLAPHEPGKINLYLLAIGGDGSQEVFHRETDFVRQQFDRDYGTEGRSVALINSRKTVSEVPMATLTSIRESVSAIAARMDKENDILFLFLTSHGSKDHEFKLDQNGMDLRGLEAKELGKILAESGIRWKVVVVSACYAGGFIDPLKDEHTMVMTAARRDRTSFGCADDRDFTYFGKAFFERSLPGSRSFGDAFDKAKALVATWETEDFKDAKEPGEVTHSEPQIYRGALIDAYLKKWQAQKKPTLAAKDVKQQSSAQLADEK
ncbi:caspase domain protein [Collimonas arenae]|uniref:Caspase domain protein n=2 Tax=Collimonas arenae TaxID=279058 RepID=A0A127QJR9_9BURK|nr:caspase domain protein [Collimonas arenae]